MDAAMYRVSHSDELITPVLFTTRTILSKISKRPLPLRETRRDFGPM